MKAVENYNQYNEKSKRKKNMPSYEIAAWIFGSILLLFLILAFFLVPCLSSDQRGILRFLMALAGGLFAFFFVGGVVLEGKLRDLAISAAGGAAIFVLIQFVSNPFPDKPCNQPIVESTGQLNSGNFNQVDNANQSNINSSSNQISQGNLELINKLERLKKLNEKISPKNENTPQQQTPNPNNNKTPNSNINKIPTPIPISSVDVEITVTVMRNGQDVSHLIDDLEITLFGDNLNKMNYGKTYVLFKDIRCNQFVDIGFNIVSKKSIVRENIKIPCDKPIFSHKQRMDI